MPNRKVVEVPRLPEEDAKINNLQALVEADLFVEQKRDEIIEVENVMSDIVMEFLDNQDLLDKRTWDIVENVGKVYLVLKTILGNRYPEATKYSEREVRDCLFVLLGSSRDADRMMEHVIERLATEQLIAHTSDYQVVFRDISEGDYIDTHPKYDFFIA